MSSRRRSRKTQDLTLAAPEALALTHDTLNRNTRAQFKQVFDALRQLMTPPDPPKRPVGFVIHENKSPGTKGRKMQARTRGKA